VEEIEYDAKGFEAKLQLVQEKYENVFVPEYFEKRVPRKLAVFDLSN
jgi:hypothetical protein